MHADGKNELGEANQTRVDPSERARQRHEFTNLAWGPQAPASKIPKRVAESRFDPLCVCVCICVCTSTDRCTGRSDAAYLTSLLAGPTAVNPIHACYDVRLAERLGISIQGFRHQHPRDGTIHVGDNPCTTSMTPLRAALN